MAITFVNFGAQTNGNPTSSLSVAAPASILANDIIIMHLTNFFTGAVTAPDASWNLILFNTGDAGFQELWWHVATGPADGPWIFTSSAQSLSAIASAYRGVDTSNPIDVANATDLSGVNVLTVTSPSVTPQFSGGLLLNLVMINHNTTDVYTPDAALTSIRYNVIGQTSGANSGMINGDVAAPSAGVPSATYTTTWTPHATRAISAAVVLKQSVSPISLTVVNNHIDYGY